MFLEKLLQYPECGFPVSRSPRQGLVQAETGRDRPNAREGRLLHAPQQRVDLPGETAHAHRVVGLDIAVGQRHVVEPVECSDLFHFFSFLRVFANEFLHRIQKSGVPFQAFLPETFLAAVKLHPAVVVDHGRVILKLLPGRNPVGKVVRIPDSFLLHARQRAQFVAQLRHLPRLFCRRRIGSPIKMPERLPLKHPVKCEDQLPVPVVVPVIRKIRMKFFCQPELLSRIGDPGVPISAVTEGGIKFHFFIPVVFIRRVEREGGVEFLLLCRRGGLGLIFGEEPLRLFRTGGQ